MNTELLLQVKEKILQEPENFGMRCWDGENSLGEKCGTAHCIGGWGMFLLGCPCNWSIEQLRKAFNVPDGTGIDRLFVVDRWPQQFREAYDAARENKDLRVCAKIAAKRIDHFIATEGRE